MFFHYPQLVQILYKLNLAISCSYEFEVYFPSHPSFSSPSLLQFFLSITHNPTIQKNRLATFTYISEIIFFVHYTRVITATFIYLLQNLENMKHFPFFVFYTARAPCSQFHYNRTKLFAILKIVKKTI